MAGSTQGSASLQRAWGELLDKYGDHEIPDGGAFRQVRIQINTRLRSTLGRWKGSVRLVEIAGWLVDSDDHEQIIETVRHEAAHALAGSAAGHGPEWRAWARALDARPARCGAHDTWLNYAPEAKRSYKYEILCGKCGDIVARRKQLRSVLVRRYRSGCCTAKLEAVELR